MYSDGINALGYCYDNGIGTKIDKQKAFELYSIRFFLKMLLSSFIFSI